MSTENKCPHCGAEDHDECIPLDAIPETVATLRQQLADCRNQLVTAEAVEAGLRADVADLQQQLAEEKTKRVNAVENWKHSVNAVESLCLTVKGHHTCAYCGWVGKGNLNINQSRDAVIEHVKTCDKHPLQAEILTLRVRLETAEARDATLRNQLVTAEAVEAGLRADVEEIQRQLAEEKANSAKAKSCPVCLGNCIQSTSGDCCRACKGEGTREAYEDNLRARLETAEARDATLTNLLRRAKQRIACGCDYHCKFCESVDAEIAAFLEGKPPTPVSEEKAKWEASKDAAEGLDDMTQIAADLRARLEAEARAENAEKELKGAEQLANVALSDLQHCQDEHQTLTNLLRRVQKREISHDLLCAEVLYPDKKCSCGHDQLQTEITAALEGKPLGNSERFNRDNEETTGDKQQ